MFPNDAAYAQRFEFRAREWNESRGQYHAALIAHVEAHDIAAGHELRVGRLQADWTAADIAAFRQVMSHSHGPRETLRPGFQHFNVVDAGPVPVTEAALLALADRSLEYMAGRRRDGPTANLPIFASVILTTGRLLTTATSRGDRLAILKFMVRTHPVFGFLLVFDAFMHLITTDPATGHESTAKRDALLAQLGTRDLRVMKRRPYRFEGKVVQFDDPPPTDIDIHAAGPEAQITDPYACLFVSVPMPTGAPS